MRGGGAISASGAVFWLAAMNAAAIVVSSYFTSSLAPSTATVNVPSLAVSMLLTVYSSSRWMRSRLSQGTVKPSRWVSASSCACSVAFGLRKRSTTEPFTRLGAPVMSVPITSSAAGAAM